MEIKARCALGCANEAKRKAHPARSQVRGVPSSNEGACESWQDRVNLVTPRQSSRTYPRSGGDATLRRHPGLEEWQPGPPVIYQADQDTHQINPETLGPGASPPNTNPFPVEGADHLNPGRAPHQRYDCISPSPPRQLAPLYDASSPNVNDECSGSF